MKNVIIILKSMAFVLFLSPQVLAQNQNINLLTHTSGLDDERVHTVSTDPQGNIFHFGNRFGPITIEGTTLPLIGSMIFEYYLARYSPNGGQSWAIGIGSVGNLCFAHTPVADPFGNVIFYLQSSGVAGDTIFIGNNHIIKPSLFNDGNYFALVKLDSLGNLLWSKSLNDPTIEGGIGNPELTTDIDGNFYMAGFFFAGIKLDNFLLSPLGPFDAQFVAKGDANGNFVWANRYGSKSNDGQFFNISINEQKELFVSGGWEGDSLFVDNLTLVNPNPGGFFNTDRYICKFNTSGAAVWIKREGGTSSDGGAYLVPTANGAVACLSSVASGTSIMINENVSVSGPGSLLTQYDAQGNFKSYDTFSLDIGDAGPLESDGTDLYMGFLFNTPTHTIGGVTVPNAGGSSGTADFGVAKMDTSGTVIWAMSFGAIDEENLSSLVYSPVHGLIVGGSTTSGDWIFSNDTLTNVGLLTNEGFVASINGTIGLPENNISASVDIYPNPAKEVLNLNFNDLKFDHARVTIIGINGKVYLRSTLEIQGHQPLDISHLAPGMYIIEIGVGQNYAVRKFIKK